MALNCGIVGLPNVGKSTIFSALQAGSAECANYPFCTIEPNFGIVNVPDERLDFLVSAFKPAKVVNAVVEFVDIAGLVRGASKGEGLGNQFLSHIREVSIIAHIVRCFDDPDIIHVENKIDPASDIETINVELALADLDTLQKKKEKAERALRVQGAAEKKSAALVLQALAKIELLLQNGKRARDAALTDEEKEVVADCHFITMKPQIYVCNVDEEGARQAAAGNYNKYVKEVMRHAEAEGAQCIVLCGKFEAELAAIEDAAEKKLFLEEISLKKSALETLIYSAYKLLGLSTFFTAGDKECRAWTVRSGSTAPVAAGVIHTDFQKGFIKAEVYSYEDFVKYSSEAKIKEAGRYRLEGKDYIMRDGDVVFFKFNPV